MKPISLLRSILTVGGWTLLSRGAGFARDMMMAAYLGAGPIADAFNVAFSLPNMFRRFFAEGAFNMAFVPMFAKKLEGGEDAQDFARDAFNGLRLWQRTLDPTPSRLGFLSSAIAGSVLPVAAGGRLYVVSEGKLQALDAATGKTRWQVARRSTKAAFTTPCIFQADGGKPQLILSSWAHGVTSLDPRSGKTYWELPVFQFRAVGSPTIAAGLIYASAGVGGVGRQMVAVRPGDTDGTVEAKVAYRVESPFPYVTVPVAKGNLVFLWQDRGIVTCLDGPTGKVHWRERAGGDCFSSPIRVADRIYCPTRNGEMVVLAASDRYEPLARFPLGEKTHSTPAVAEGVMYVRTLSQLAAIGGKNR